MNQQLIYILLLGMMLVSSLIQALVSKRFREYSEEPIASGLTGAQAAEKILREAGLTDIRIERSGKALSDHYDPTSRVLRLSDGVINQSSVAAVSIAAHEAGHALQHADNYKPLILRSASVPAVNIGSRAAWPIFLLGIFLSSQALVEVGIVLFSLVVLFALITLPVEFNASARALSLLSSNGTLRSDELPGAKKMLSSAAMTYVVSALVAILQLLRLIAIFSNSKSRK